MLRKPDKAEPHAALLRRPDPFAGGDDLCLLRAGHGRAECEHEGTGGTGESRMSAARQF